MVDYLITPASGAAKITDSSTVATTPRTSELWASGTTLYWQTTAVGASVPGAIGGTVTDTYLPIGTAADTLGNFLPAYVDLPTDKNVFLGIVPASLAVGSQYNTSFGHLALENLTTGDANTAVGMNAGNDLTQGYYNTLIGYAAGAWKTTEIKNTCIGYAAGPSAGGGDNVNVGTYAGYSHTGNYCVIIGSDAAYNTTGVDSSVIIGRQAWGSGVGTGDSNVVIGAEAAKNATGLKSSTVIGTKALGSGIATAQAGTIIGLWAGYSLTSGYENTLIGAYAGKNGNFNNTVMIGRQAGEDNTANSSHFVGFKAGIENTSGGSNMAEGYEALKTNTTGSKNTAIGYRTLYSNVHGDSNVAVGYGALYTNAPADNTGKSVAIGFEAGYSATTASYNTFIGYKAGHSTTTAEESVYIGYLAGEDNDAQYNVFIGNGAGEQATGVGSSVAIGRQAMGAAAATGDDNVAVGYRSMYDLTTGLQNVAVGHFSLPNVTSGSYNVTMGRNAMNSAAGSHRNTAVGHSVLQAFTAAGESKNTAVGMNAMFAVTAGTFNTAVGYEAIRGNSGVTPTGNCALGYQALRGVTTADSVANFNNVAIGMRALYSASGADNNVGIGFSALSGAAGSTGDSNVAIGSYAGRDALSPSESVMVGMWSGKSITTANYNTIVGYNAVSNLTTSPNNTAMGHSALRGHATQDTTSSNNVAIGMAAMYVASGANNNTALGYGALSGSSAGMTGDSNVAIGLSAMANATNPYNTVAIGNYAGYDVTTGYENTLVGYYAGGNISTGYLNTAMGNSALRTLVSGRRNTAVGESVLYDALGSYNTSMGWRAGFELTSGEENVFIGYRAAYNGTTTQGAVYVGREAGYNNNGNYCTFIGDIAGYTATSEDESVFIGRKAGYTNEGNYNVLIGSEAGYLATSIVGSVIIGRQAAGAAAATGDNNVAVGYRSMYDLTTGAENVAVGYYAGQNINTGGGNTLIGRKAGDSITDGVYNTMLGHDAGLSETGDYNTFIGHRAGEGGAGEPDSHRNVAIGYLSMYRQSGANYNVGVGTYSLAGADFSAGSNVAMGYAAGQNATSGDANTYLGYYAGSSGTTADHNVMIGNQAGQEITTGGENVHIGSSAGRYVTTGSHNASLGYQSMFTNVDGSYNVAIGSFSLFTTEAGTAGYGKNVGIGYQAGYNNTTGTGNVFIGYAAGANTGHDTESNKLVIANTNTTSPLMTGSFGDGTIQFNVSGNKPDSFVIKGDQTAGEDGLTIDNWEPRIQLKNRRATDETWKISAPNDSSSLQFRKDSNLIAAIFPSTNGGGVTFGIAAAAALPGVAIASGASLSFDNTSANRIYRTASKLAYTSTESHNFNNPITVTGGVRPGTDNTYSLGTATLKWTTTYLDDYIEINSGGAITNHAGAGRFWVSGTTPYFNASIIQLGTGVPATIADGRWADGTSSAAGLAIADYGAVANAISTVTAGYLTWNNDTSTLQVRKLAIGGASFSLGGQEVTDIKISSDAASTSNSDLVTAGYVDAHAGGGGTIGGSITDNQVAFGATTADSIEGSANLTYDGTNLTLARTADATSRGISIQDNEGTETIRLATASADQGLLYLKGPTGGNAIYLDGGTGVSYIDAGNVGIGTTAPDRKLDVNAGSATAFLASGTGGGTYGVARIVDNADSVPLELVGQRGDSEGPVLRLKHESASPNGGDYVGTVAFTGYTSTNALGNYAAIRGRAIDVTNGETDGALLFQNFIDNNRTTGMILSGAKLGVGPSGYTGFAPSEYLEVKSSADDDPAIKLYNARSPAASGALITQHRGSSINIISTGSAVAPFRWTIQSTEMMRLDDTGLGIGTTAPAHKLDVVGTTQLSGNAIIDGQLLNVTKTAKMDISGDYTMGTSYSHYTATSIAGDSPGDINVRVTTPASPTVGDEYWIVGSTYHGPGGFTGAATIDIIANTSQTINKVGSAIELAATASTSSATTPNFRLGHLLCVDTNTWALFISDYGPTS